MTEFWGDVRYAVRALLRQPALTAAVLLTLAIGVGLNGAVFSVVNAYLFQPLPVRDPGRIVFLGQTTPEMQRPHEMSYPDVRDQAALPAYAGIAVFANSAANLGASAGDRAERVFVNESSANFFSLLGVDAMLGRTFAADEDQGHMAHRVVVLDYRFWQTHFRGDSAVLGRTVAVNGQGASVIGVLPASFHGVQAVIEPQVYMPLNQVSSDLTEALTRREWSFLNVIARLAPGVRLAEAKDATHALAARIAKDNPTSHAGIDVVVVPERLSRPHLFVSAMTPLASAVFMVLSLLVLLVACANVAGLLLSRSVARERELAVRAALGAGRGRIARLLLMESLVLGAGGGALALLVATWCASLLSRLRIAIDAPVRFGVEADWRVFAFTLGAALFAGVLAGLAPALRGSTKHLHDALRSGPRAGGPARQRIRAALVVAQVAVAVVVLTAAGMFMRSVQRAGEVDLGFHPDHVLLASMSPSDQGYDGPRTHVFEDRLLERVRALPGVTAAGLARRTPLGYNNSSDRVEPEGGLPDGSANLVALTNVVSPGYLATLDIPLRAGRDFEAADDTTAPRVAIVSEAFARQVWPGGALGRRFHEAGDTVSYTVVGVAGNTIWMGLGEGPKPFIYYSTRQRRNPDFTINVRTAGDPAAVIPAVRAVVRELDADLPLFDVRSFREHLDGGISFFFLRIGAMFAGLFGLLAAGLGAVGLFGLIAFGVAQRQREIGIRLALGADASAVQRSVVARGLKLAGLGLAVGIPGALLVARAMQGMLLNTGPGDPVALGGGVALLLLVAVFAAWLPARRVSAVNPIEALRAE